MLAQRLHETLGKRRMKKGLLDQIIQDAKKRNNVTHLEIQKASIQMRVLIYTKALLHVTAALFLPWGKLSQCLLSYASN
jgi:hypothetical protein